MIKDNEEYFGDLKKIVSLINSRFKDDVSKQIFMNRLMFSSTGDYTYIKNVVLTTESGKKIYSAMKNCNTPIGIFGAGRIGKKIIKMYRDITFACFIDNNKRGEYEGLPVFSLNEFAKEYPQGTIVISMRDGYSEVEEQIKQRGIPNSRIINYAHEHVHMSDRRQYFDLEQLWDLQYEREVFIDGGAFDGVTSKNFLEILRAKQEKNGFAYVWEPETKFSSVIDGVLQEYKDKIKIIYKGLWNKREMLSFVEDGVCSMIDNAGKETIEVDSIDSVIDEPVSFIKMDIEGAEYKALSGAKETVKKCRPRLAISIYHRNEDIIDIPKLIIELGDYELYLRHYTLTEGDTVLYALPQHL